MPVNLADHQESVWQTARRKLRTETGPSFDAAWEEMRRNGNPKPFVFKTLGVGVGAFLMGDGIYNMVRGAEEQVEDALLSDKTHRNVFRIFTGTMELTAGAALLYAALTKSGLGR